MLKTDKKYNIGHNAIVTDRDQRRKLSLWYHIGVLDNHFWNKKLTLCLRSTHKINIVRDLENFIKKK